MATVSTRCCFSQSARACKSAVQGAEGAHLDAVGARRGDSDDMEVAADVGARGVGVKDVEGAQARGLGVRGGSTLRHGSLPEEEAKQAGRRYNEP